MLEIVGVMVQRLKISETDPTTVSTISTVLSVLYDECKKCFVI